MNQTIIKTINEMFSQRGYDDIKTGDVDEREILIGYDNGKKVVAFLEVITKLNNSVIQNIYKLMDNLDCNHAILVHQGDPTPSANNAINDFANIDMKFELFSSIDLMYNITKHYLVPKHERVSKEELADIQSKLDIKALPKISKKDDPIAKFYDYSKGDVIKVYRKGGEIGYRIVIS
jgi:DNA-directed RNA polymerase I, II, and III subunit RPABC1